MIVTIVAELAGVTMRRAVCDPYVARATVQAVGRVLTQMNPAI